MKSAGDEAMDTLQDQWYNALVSGLSLDSDSFQIVQGSNPLGNTSKEVWNTFNSVPPHSLSHVFDGSEVNEFYADYKAVLNSLKYQSGDQWAEMLGDKIYEWRKYKMAHEDQIGEKGLLPVFRTWAEINLDPNERTRAVAAFEQASHGPIAEAQAAVFNPQYIDPDLGPKFSLTVKDLTDALAKGQKRTINFDSQTASKDVEHTWAQGEASGVIEFFTGGASGSYDHLTEKASSSRVTIDATFDSVVARPAKPGGWFHSDALNIAYTTKDNTVWQSGVKPTWETTFGDEGNLKRLATEMVAVDGIEATITSHASYSEEERKQIEGSASVSYWPFGSFHASAGYSSDVSFDDQGTMTVKISVAKGNPGILGVNVDSMGKILGN